LCHLSASGNTLNVEERACLQVAMLERKNSEKLSKVLFWGKIFGEEADYLVAYGESQTLGFPNRKFYYCTSKDFELKQFPGLSEDRKVASAALKGPFKGNPSFPLEEVEDDGADDEDGVVKDFFREEHRLAYTINMIDHDTFTVPKGAYLVEPGRKVVANYAYSGLSSTDALLLSSYFHFRPAEGFAAKNANKRGLVGAGEFLDSLADDVPKGSWSVKANESSTGVIVSSLMWPGYFFYSLVDSNGYGGAYFGNGLKNEDIAFML